MGTNDIGAEKAKLGYAKIAGDYRKEQFESLTASIKSADALVSRGYEKLAGDTADLRGKAVDAVTRFQASQHAGEGAQRMRSTVEMAKLLVNAPVDFAKAAYAPDESMLRDVRMAANPSGDTNTMKGEIAKKAWEVFYTNTVPGAGNLWGTYRAMEAQYGKDTHALTSEGGLEAKRQTVMAQIDTEKGAAVGFQERYRAFADIDGAWTNFLARNPQLDPNADATYDAFEADTGIKDRLAKVQDTPFIAQLQKTISNERSYENDLYREDALTGIRKAEEARDREIGLRDKLTSPDEPPALTADSERDLMAAWLKRPEIQAWAKQNGLKVGRVDEITEQQKADLAAGRIPQSSVTKYGVLTDGPDDDKAVDFAYNQMKRTPERDIFRAVGVTRGGGPNTIVEVEVGLDPAPYLVTETGKFYKNAAGKYVKKEDVLATPFDEATGLPAGLVETSEPPPVQIRRGVRRPMLVNDAAGSVRLIDEETRNEEYVNPQHVRRIVEPNVRSDAERPSLARTLRGATVESTLKRTGLGEDENDMDIGDKPNAKKDISESYPGNTRGPSVQARRERVNDIRRDLPIVPDAALDERLKPRPNTDAFVEEHSQRAKASDTTNSTGSEVTDRRAQPGNAALSQFVRNPKPDASGNVLGAAGRDFREATPEGAAAKEASKAKSPGQQFNVLSTKEAARNAPIEKAIAEPAPKVSTDTTTPSPTTPTAGTDPRRAMFKTRKYRKDDEDPTGVNAGP